MALKLIAIDESGSGHTKEVEITKALLESILGPIGGGEGVARGTVVQLAGAYPDGYSAIGTSVTRTITASRHSYLPPKPTALSLNRLVGHPVRSSCNKGSVIFPDKKIYNCRGSLVSVFGSDVRFSSVTAENASIEHLFGMGAIGNNVAWSVRSSSVVFKNIATNTHAVTPSIENTICRRGQIVLAVSSTDALVVTNLLSITKYRMTNALSTVGTIQLPSVGGSIIMLCETDPGVFVAVTQDGSGTIRAYRLNPDAMTSEQVGLSTGRSSASSISVPEDGQPLHVINNGRILILGASFQPAIICTRSDIVHRTLNSSGSWTLPSVGGVMSADAVIGDGDPETCELAFYISMSRQQCIYYGTRSSGQSLSINQSTNNFTKGLTSIIRVGGILGVRVKHITQFAGNGSSGGLTAAQVATSESCHMVSFPWMKDISIMAALNVTDSFLYSSVCDAVIGPCNFAGIGLSSRLTAPYPFVNTAHGIAILDITEAADSFSTSDYTSTRIVLESMTNGSVVFDAVKE